MFRASPEYSTPPEAFVKWPCGGMLHARTHSLANGCCTLPAASFFTACQAFIYTFLLLLPYYPLCIRVQNYYNAPWLRVCRLRLGKPELKLYLSWAIFLGLNLVLEDQRLTLLPSFVLGRMEASNPWMSWWKAPRSCLQRAVMLFSCSFFPLYTNKVRRKANAKLCATSFTQIIRVLLLSRHRLVTSEVTTDRMHYSDLYMQRGANRGDQQQIP